MIKFTDDKEKCLLEYYQDDVKIGEAKYEITDTYIKVDMPTIDSNAPITLELQQVIQSSRLSKVTEFQRNKEKNAKMEMSFEVEVDTGDGIKRKYTL